MERDIRTEHQIDWPETVATAKRRRQEMKLTQRRLAAVAGVSLPTVVKFEAGQDIRLSSALAILKVLDMIALHIEGVLMILAADDGEAGPFHAVFAPNAGPGGALEQRTIADRAGLNAFLDGLGISTDAKKRAFVALAQNKTADIPNIQLSPAQLRRYWPIQFPPVPV